MQDDKAEVESKPKRKKISTGGRPRNPVDTEILRGLARIQCTMSEMSAVLGVSVDTLERNFADIIKSEKENGRASLRRMQFAAANKGNVAMMIWLGKQLLGQRDRHDLDVQTGVTLVWDQENLGDL